MAHELPANDEDPFADFVVYDRDEELVYENDDEDASSALAVNRDKVAVPRRILYIQGVLLGVVAVVCFALGVIFGEAVSSRSEPESASARPCLVTGEVTYVRGRQGSSPDEGSVAIIVPQAARPQEKAPVKGLRPQDAVAVEEHAGLIAIQQIGGAYCRADANGRFELRAPKPDDYYLLVVSRHRRRAPDEQPDGRDLAQMGRYFSPPTDLIGRNKYEWRKESIRRDTDLSIVFE